MNKVLLSISCCSAMLLAAVSNSWAVEYRVRDLGVSAIRSEASGISDSGEIAGWCLKDDGVHNFRVRTDGSVVDLGNTGAFSRGMTKSGSIITDFGYYDPGDQYVRMTQYLGSRRFATAMNDRGGIAGNGEPSAFYWSSSTGLQSIGVLPGDSSSVATAMNSSGQVVGLSMVRDARYGSIFHAFRWTPDGGLQALQPLAGGTPVTSYAYGINDLGQVVGWSATETGSGEAMLWDADGSLHDIGRGFAYAINNPGQVVGVADGHAFLRDPDGTRTVLPNLFAQFNNSPKAINDAGVIVGNAYDGTDWHAIVWEPVPEPSSIIVLLSGIAALGPLLRRRT